MPDPSDNDDKIDSPKKPAQVPGESPVVGPAPTEAEIKLNRSKHLTGTLKKLWKLDPAFRSDVVGVSKGLKKVFHQEDIPFNNGQFKILLTLIVGPVEPISSEFVAELSSVSVSHEMKLPSSVDLEALASSPPPEEEVPGSKAPAWLPFVAPGLGGLTVLLLLVLLFKSGPTLPQPLATQESVGSIATDLKAESAKVNQAIVTQTEKVANLEETLGKLADSGVKLPPQFAAEVAKKVDVPKGVGAADLQPISQALEKLKAQVEKADPPPALPADYWPRLATELTKAVGSASPKAAASPAARDTYLVITHGSAMNANKYIGTLREALTRFLGRGPDAPVRLGLAVAATTELTNFVSPADPLVDLKSFNTPSPDSSEAPQLFGRRLKQLFPPDRLTQRTILLVSDQAMAPAIDSPEDMEGWNALSQVDVLLLATKDPKDFKLDDWKRYARWCSFAESRQGSAQLIGYPADERRQNDLLRETLRRLILQAD